MRCMKSSSHASPPTTTLLGEVALRPVRGHHAKQRYSHVQSFAGHYPINCIVLRLQSAHHCVFVVVLLLLVFGDHFNLRVHFCLEMTRTHRHARECAGACCLVRRWLVRPTLTFALATPSPSIASPVSLTCAPQEEQILTRHSNWRA